MKQVSQLQSLTSCDVSLKVMPLVHMDAWWIDDEAIGYIYIVVVGYLGLCFCDM